MILILESLLGMESDKSFSGTSLGRVSKHQGRQKWGVGNKAISYVNCKNMKLN